MRHTFVSLLSESSLPITENLGVLEVTIALNCSIAEYSLSIGIDDWFRESSSSTSSAEK